VVFYANYLKFFERARTEWLRSLGFAQRRLAEEHGTMFVVTDTTIAYRAPARLDDELDVTVVVERTGPATITLAQQARRGAATMAEGTVRIACVDATTLAPRRVPDVIARAVESAAHAPPPNHDPTTPGTSRTEARAA
jgi:acyl-CoA thioester hydrolase